MSKAGASTAAGAGAKSARGTGGPVKASAVGSGSASAVKATPLSPMAVSRKIKIDAQRLLDQQNGTGPHSASGSGSASARNGGHRRTGSTGLALKSAAAAPAAGAGASKSAAGASGAPSKSVTPPKPHTPPLPAAAAAGGAASATAAPGAAAAVSVVPGAMVHGADPLDLLVASITGAAPAVDGDDSQAEYVDADELAADRTPTPPSAAGAAAGAGKSADSKTTALDAASASSKATGKTKDTRETATVGADQLDRDGLVRAYPRLSLFVTTSYGKLHYMEQGPAAAPFAVVCMHGDGPTASCDVWEAILTPLSNAGYRVLSFSMPGYGLSGGQQVSFRNSGAAVIGEAMDVLGIKKCVLVGRSVGGKSAYHAAVSDPKRVLRLAVTHPVIPPADVMAAVRQPVLLTWAKDDAKGHPYAGPHGAAYCVSACRATRTRLVSWTEKAFHHTPRKFYATVYVKEMLKFLAPLTPPAK